MSLFSDIKEEAMRELMDEGSMVNPYNRLEAWREREEAKSSWKDDGDPKLFRDNNN